MRYPRFMMSLMTRTALLFLLASFASAGVAAEELDRHAWRPAGPAVGHAFPHLVVSAPGVESTSETGIGALMPWADRLWMIGYVAHVRGGGIGLYEVREDLSYRLHPESVTGTFANRLVHWETKQAIIGPHVIAPDRTVRTIPELAKHRLTATARHLTKPKERVYFLTMEGLLFDVDLKTLEAVRIADLVEKLELPKGAQPHFKAMFSAQGRLVVANNTFGEPEFLGERRAGRLAEWTVDGPWKTLETNPFIEVSGKQNPTAGAAYGNTMFAVGWDHRSVIFRWLHGGEWKRARMPFGSHSWSHTWNTEWMRIREVQTERYLMDAFGLFYELPALVYGGEVFDVRPISSHLRICPDFLSWRGMLVLAGDQTDNAVGQPQSGPWFGTLDDLWEFGKPAGFGAVWKEDAVKAGEISDRFLMNGFDQKVLHLRHDQDGSVAFTIEVDPVGDGRFVPYHTEVVRSDGYGYHVFEPGYHAFWVRVVAQNDCVATATFHYR